MNTEVDLYDQALAAYEKALEVYKNSGNRSDEASVLIKIGDLYRAKGEEIQRPIPDPPRPPIPGLPPRPRPWPPHPFWNQAIESYEEALKAYQEDGDNLNAANVWVKIGDTYLSASREVT